MQVHRRSRAQPSRIIPATRLKRTLPPTNSRIASSSMQACLRAQIPAGIEVRYSRSMGSATALSVEEYLHTSFPDLDREYRDGEIVERTLPDYLHGKTQALLAAFFLALEEQLLLHPCVETRMRVRPNRYLIPDVAVFHPDEPNAIPETPPLVAIEILSPDDKMGAVREKLEEYRTWGVPHVWLVDPRSRRFYTGDKGLTEVSALVISELGIEITKHDLFKSFK
jgi:Uma2 family endonuclease